MIFRKGQTALEYTILFAVMVSALFFFANLNGTLHNYFNNVVNTIIAN